MAGLQILLEVLIISGTLSYVLLNQYEDGRLKLILRPLTTFFVVLLALLQEPITYPVYKLLILSGLISYLVSDMLTSSRKGKNKPEYLFILFAWLLFGLAFAEYPGPYWSWGILLPIAAYAIIFLLITFRRADRLKPHLIVGTIVLSWVVWQAAGRAWYLAQEGVNNAFFGILLILISYSLMAYDLIVKPFKIAPFLIMGLYWIALSLIALSI